MRSLQLLTLALLATAARAELILDFSGSSIIGNLADGTPFSQFDCDGAVESAFTICDGTADYGNLSLSLIAAGSGRDNGPQLHATATGTVGFTDQIIFYGPAGGDGTVAWNISTQEGGESAAISLNLPTKITFNAPYGISIFISDMVAANTGEDEHGAIDSSVINGFQVFGPNCDAELGFGGTEYNLAMCGAPIGVSVHTQSGFLYGGHVPEPSSLWLLATAGIAWLAAGWRRNAQ